jgi:hypothetical protein
MALRWTPVRIAHRHLVNPPLGRASFAVCVCTNGCQASMLVVLTASTNCLGLPYHKFATDGTEEVFVRRA